MSEAQPRFRVEWGGPEHGWIDLFLHGATTFELSAGIYDPFPDMVAWVKACCSGEGTHSFVWNDESRDHRFEYCCAEQVLTIHLVSHFAPDELEWEGILSLEELHRAFYLEFFAFCDATEYNEAHWEGVSPRVLFERNLLGRPAGFLEPLLALNSTELNSFWQDLEEYGNEYGNGDGYRTPDAREEFQRIFAAVQHRLWMSLPVKYDTSAMFGPEWDQADSSRRQLLLEPHLDRRPRGHGMRPPSSYRDPELDAWPERRSIP